MINSLWSLCQACPAVPVDKRHVDHRGRYRWHEYQDVPTKVIVQKPPQPAGGSLDPLITRKNNGSRGDDPCDDCLDTNYEAVQFFMEPNGQPVDTNNCEQLQLLRRSRSEGPSPAHGSAHRTEPGLMAAWVGRRRHVTDGRFSNWMPAAAAAEEQQQRTQQHETEQQQRHFATSEYRLQFAWPSSGSVASRMHTESHHHADLDKELKNSTVSDTGEIRPQEEKHHEEATDRQDEKPRRRRYKTEYRKKFRPFSLYQYVDGKFSKPNRSNGSESVPEPSVEKSCWYQEVVELRKKAGEYKFRGWGGELLPEHMAHLYGQQFDIWEQVSRRTSLSALALAAASPRPAPVTAEKENIKQKKSSPKKIPPMPGHAQSVNAARKEAPKKQVDEPDRQNKRGINQRSISAEGKPARTRAANKPKSPAHQANVTLAVRPSLGAIFHPATPSRSISAGPENRSKKNAPSSINVHQAKAKKDVSNKPHVTINAEPNDEKQAIVGGALDEKDVKNQNNLKAPAVAETLLDIGLVRSPPEPTRVKSPEQIMVRSPDSVNWTVPLETGKTFTVTQNIREGDNSRPHSELKVTMVVRPAAAVKSSTETGANVAAIPRGSTGGTVGEPVESGESKETQGEESSVAPISQSSIVTEPTSANQDEIKASPVAEKPLENVQISQISEPSQTVKENDLVPTETSQTVNENDVVSTETNQIVKQSEIPSSTENIADTSNTSAEIVLETPETKKESEDVQEPVKSVLNGHEVKEASKPQEKDISPTKPAVVQPVKPVPGTTLRCLEDPIFSTVTPKTAATASPKLPPAPMARGPRYRVLEAPTELPNYKVLETPGVPSDVLYQPVTTSPYKVLEAPSSTAKTSIPPPVTSPSTSPSTSRSLASDVLEKARTRFDRFWGKKDSDK